MNLLDAISYKLDLFEGIHDPYLFKAIIMAGTPGSGKSFYTKTLAKHFFGLKVVDEDRFIEMALAQKKEIDLSTFKRTEKLIDIQKTNYIKGHLGLILDSTAQNLVRTMQNKMYLESFGYDVMMFYVRCDLVTAKQRAKAREEQTGRGVDMEYLEMVHHTMGQNQGQYKKEFKHFIEIDNSTDKTADLELPLKRVQKFLESPVANDAAGRFIDQHRENPNEIKSLQTGA